MNCVEMWLTVKQQDMKDIKRTKKEQKTKLKREEDCLADEKEKEDQEGGGDFHLAVESVTVVLLSPDLQISGCSAVPRCPSPLDVAHTAVASLPQSTGRHYQSGDRVSLV